MRDQRTSPPFYAGKVYRLLTTAFGVLLLGVGVYALFFADTSPVFRFAGGSALVLVGYNMLSSAYKAKEPWLSKLGPLP